MTGLIILVVLFISVSSEVYDYNMYLGSWSGKLSEFSQKSGRIYLEVEIYNEKGSIVLKTYDGDWESNPYIYFYSQNMTSSTNSLNGTVFVYPVESYKMAYCQAELSITTSSSLKASMTGKNCTISLSIQASKLTKTEYYKQAYIFLAIFLFFKLGEYYILRNIYNQCSRMAVSRTISLISISLSSIIDLFFMLWPISLAQVGKITLLMYIVMSIVPMIIIREKSLIYKKVTDIRQGYSYRNSFSTYILIGMLYIALSRDLYQFNVIVSNSVFGFHIYRNYHRQSVDKHFIVFLIVEQLLITLYFCYCSWNFMVWEPDPMLSFIAFVVAVSQVLCLYWRAITRRSGDATVPLLSRALSPDAAQRVIQNSHDCAICLCPLGNVNIVVTRCEHAFHHNCLLPWLDIQTLCPVCRGDIEEFVGP